MVATPLVTNTERSLSVLHASEAEPLAPGLEWSRMIIFFVVRVTQSSLSNYIIKAAIFVISENKGTVFISFFVN